MQQLEVQNVLNVVMVIIQQEELEVVHNVTPLVQVMVIVSKQLENVMVVQLVIIIITEIVL